MTTTLFTNVSIFEGTKPKAKPGDVLVEGNRVKAVSARRGGIDRARAAHVIDGAGCRTRRHTSTMALPP